MIVHLHPTDLSWADRVAKQRIAEFQRGFNRIEHRYMMHERNPAEQAHIHRLACWAELAVARTLEQPWTAAKPGAGLPDVGHNIEVRCALRTGLNLVVRVAEIAKHPPATPYVLCVPAGDYAIQIKGWQTLGLIDEYGQPAGTDDVPLTIYPAELLRPISQLKATYANN